MMKLIHETDLLVTQPGAGVFRQPVNILAVNQHLPGINGIQPAQRIQQGGFTRAGSTNNGQGFASSHLQINILPDRYLLRTTDIGFAQPLCLQYPITHNAVPPPAEPGKPATTGTVWPKSSASARLR